MGIPKPQLHATLTHMGVRVSPRPVSAEAKIINAASATISMLHRWKSGMAAETT